jgi:hypothetical protein
MQSERLFRFTGFESAGSTVVPSHGPADLFAGFVPEPQGLMRKVNQKS